MWLFPMVGCRLGLSCIVPRYHPCAVRHPTSLVHWSVLGLAAVVSRHCPYRLQQPVRAQSQAQLVMEPAYKAYKADSQLQAAALWSTGCIYSLRGVQRLSAAGEQQQEWTDKHLTHCSNQGAGSSRSSAMSIGGSRQHAACMQQFWCAWAMTCSCC